MYKLQRAMTVATAIACLAATPGLAQTQTSAPRIYDAAGRLVGTALSAEPSGYGRVLLTFDNGAAVLNITPTGLLLFLQGPLPGSAASVAPASAAIENTKLYYDTPDCSGPAYKVVSQFPPYGDFKAEGLPNPGYSQAGTIRYPSRPFKIAHIVATGSNGICINDLDTSLFVGVAATAKAPSYKLPFYTK